MSENAIIPVEQKQIDFQGDIVTAVIAPDGTVYVPVRPLCELIGADWTSQYRRIKRDAILNDVSMSVAVTATHIDDPKSRQRKTQDMIALPLNYLNGWLFGMNPSRVKPEIKESLLRYQRDCYNVLYEAFGRNTIAVREDAELIKSDSPQGAAYRTALAVAKLAREQYYMGLKVDDNTRRIGLLEAQLTSPAGKVTQAQAQQIASAVKTVAMTLAEKFQGNHFGRVYAELYKRYSITEYKMLPESQYDDAIEWLNQWHNSIK